METWHAEGQHLLPNGLVFLVSVSVFPFVTTIAYNADEALTSSLLSQQPAPAIRAECEKTKECAPAAHHFKACSDKVESGQGWQGGESVTGRRCAGGMRLTRSWIGLLASIRGLC
jgi:hypothetical protein